MSVTTHTPSRQATPWGTLAGFGAVRFAVSAWVRFPFTFVTPFAAGLGISVAGATTLLGLRELFGLASPALGHLADRGHERRVIVFGTVGSAAACGATAWGSLPVVAAAMALGGASMTALVIAQNAWIGHRVPFARRGRAIGVIEMSWAASLLIAIPLCALLIDRWGWRAPFVAVAGVIALSGAVSWLRLPPDRPVDDDGHPPWRRALTRRSLGLYGYAACQPIAQMMVFAVYGDWLVTRFGMSTGRVGAMSVLIGLGELSGTTTTALVVDRVGPRRAVMVGAALGAPLAASIAFVGSNAAMAVVALVAFAACIEFSFVSAIPLMTEINPTARGATVGVTIAMTTLARAVASPAAGWTYQRFGMAATGWIAAGALCAGVASMGAGLRGHR